MSYTLQNAPMRPSFLVGSDCRARSTFALGAAPGTCGHAVISRQSSYWARIPSALANGLSSNWNTYSLSLLQPGQYISREASKVVGSQYSMPITAANFRATGSYSSGVTVLSSGMIIRNLGRYGACERVL